MKRIIPDDLGKPDLSFSGFKLWISGRQFPEASDFWDGNWLMVSAHCESMGAKVWAQGPIIHLSEILHWLNGLKELNKTVEGEAELPCMEPELRAKVVLDKLGRGSLFVTITPDHLKEHHRFTFSVDQSYLPVVIKDLQRVLDKYPIKGNERRT